MSFTVCALYTDSYKHVVAQLEKDCIKFDYNYNFYNIPTKEYSSVIKEKVGYWKKAINEFGSVFWLDADARILQPIPEHWSDGITIGRYMPVEQDHARKYYIKTPSGDKLNFCAKYFLGGFGFINETMLPMVETVLEYIPMSYDDEATFNYIMQEFPELMPEYREIPYYIPWNRKAYNDICAMDEPYLIKGWTEDPNVIVAYNEKHRWDVDRELPRNPLPVYRQKNDKLLVEQKYNKQKSNMALFKLYFDQFYNTEIFYNLLDVMLHRIDVKELEQYEWYEKIDGERFIVGNWYFNVNKGYAPLGYKTYPWPKIPDKEWNQYIDWE